MTHCRLILDAPAVGPWNMAVDEVLMDVAAETDRPVWRFYQWQEPTLSLGYFQTYDDRRDHAPSRRLPCVRRCSGGGAIVHDRELTYSVAVPKTHRSARKRLALYREVHASLILALTEWGITARQHDVEVTDRQPFLCFERRAPGDVLVGQTKVAGSAQRRSGHALLQHGSILLARSEAAPSLDGLAELSPAPPDADALIESWLPKLAWKLGFRWQAQPIDQAERHRATDRMLEKYALDAFTRKRRRLT